MYLKFNNEPKKIRLRYSLVIENNSKSCSESRCVYYDFENPPEQLWQALMKGGGEVVARAGRGGRLAAPREPGRRPSRCRHAARRPPKPYVLDEVCSKCGDSSHADLKKQLKAVCMTDEEIARVAQLYVSYSVYEKSVEALPLPPLSDPIYRLPELPQSLRDALKGAHFDYAV